MSQFYRSLLLLILLSQTGMTLAQGNTTTTQYYSITPPFVVNVVDGERIRHMQITTKLHVEDYKLIPQLDTHKPAIQHALVILFSGKNVTTIKTVAGKEQLRQDAIEVVQTVMQENVGNPIIDAIYFTEFVIQ